MIRWRRLVMTLLVVVNLTGAVSVETARPASAAALTIAANGANSQFVLQDTHGDVYRFCVGGYNQYGRYAHGCWSSPYTVTVAHNWWWEQLGGGYSLVIDEWGHNGNYLRQQLAWWPGPAYGAYGKRCGWFFDRPPVGTAFNNNC